MNMLCLMELLACLTIYMFFKTERPVVDHLQYQVQNIGKKQIYGGLGQICITYDDVRKPIHTHPQY